MDLPDPPWRAAIKHLLQKPGKTARDLLVLNSLLEECFDANFDSLVQAIVRKDIPAALSVLKKKYRGSVERQLRIEAMLRGEEDVS